MRNAPGPIPEKLPNIRNASMRIQEEVIMASDCRLGGHSINSIVSSLPNDPVYLVGSNVWLRSVFDIAPCLDRPDYDLVFSTEKRCRGFIDVFMRNALDGGLVPWGMSFRLEENAFGHGRIVLTSEIDPDVCITVIDAWSMEDDESIGEHILGFPHPYQRSAFLISHPGHDMAGRLIRLTRPSSRVELDKKYPDHDVRSLSF